MVSGQLKALLGVLAVAGFQNRDKIADLLRGVSKPQPTMRITLREPARARRVASRTSLAS